MGRLLLDDAQVAISARNSIGVGAKAKAVIAVKHKERPTRKVSPLLPLFYFTPALPR